MACKTCKQKNGLKDEIIKSSEFVSKGIVWFTIIWSILAVYGIYSLISKLI